MKRVYAFFGAVLIVTLSAQVIIDIAIAIGFWRPYLYGRYLYAIGGPVFISQLTLVSFLCPFVVGALYGLKGLHKIFFLHKGNDRESAKQELQRGIAGLSLAFLLYNLISYIAMWL